VTGLLVLVRVLALVGTNPVMGHRNIPTQYKVLLAFFLTLVIVPVVPEGEPLEHGLWELAGRLAYEALVGISISFVISIVFSISSVVGQMVATASGLSMGSFLDLSQESQTTVLGSIKAILFFLVFLALDLHLLMVKALVDSFAVVAPGAGPVTSVGSGLGGAAAGIFFANHFAMVFETALTMSLPILLVVLLLNLAMGIIARVAPSMNVFFAVGVPLSASVALLVLSLSLPVIASVLMSVFGGIGPSFQAVLTTFR
jgi:flagellar biosynthetic protein FliR